LDDRNWASPDKPDRGFSLASLQTDPNGGGAILPEAVRSAETAG
jgi:hypothetical protein